MRETIECDNQCGREAEVCLCSSCYEERIESAFNEGLAYQE